MKSLVIFTAVVAVSLAQYEQFPAFRAASPRSVTAPPANTRPRVTVSPTRGTFRPTPPAPTTIRPSFAPFYITQKPAIPQQATTRPYLGNIPARPQPTTVRPPRPTLAPRPRPTRPYLINTTPEPPRARAPTTSIPVAFIPEQSSRPLLVSRPSLPVVRVPSTPAPVLVVKNQEDRNAQLLSYDNEVNPDGTYHYSYAIDNGIAAEAQGHLVNANGENDLLSESVQGSFQWGYSDGTKVLITYVADENGYQPQGDAIPTPPPIPPLIARALAWIASRREETKPFDAA